MDRLSAATPLPAEVKAPHYDRAGLRPRILHIGPGAFHRAHQAVATEAANAAGGDWGITGVSLRSGAAARALNPQGGLYSVLIRRPEGTDIQVIGALLGVIAAAGDPSAVLARMADPETEIVSMTVTEKAYAARDGRLDITDPGIARDLAQPDRPTTVVGLLAAGLNLRRRSGLRPFTPLCCDNLSANGALLRRLVLDFAGETDPALKSWIAAHVPFPATMVDRITPAPTGDTRAEAARLLGVEDAAAIETEPFSQWVIEDSFAGPRPDWTAGGAQFVDDVEPWELMKLRMLNGAHSLLAYAGLLAGKALVRDAVADPGLARIVTGHMAAAARTLPAVAGLDTDAYATALMARFANLAIAHRTQQIAMDGTQKLPQRLLAPALEARAAGRRAESFAFAVAAWVAHCTGTGETGPPRRIDDPRAAQLAAAASAQDPVPALLTLPGLFPQALRGDAEWTTRVARWHELMRTGGMATAIARFAAELETRNEEKEDTRR